MDRGARRDRDHLVDARLSCRLSHWEPVQ
jgi:hypothetical protein